MKLLVFIASLLTITIQSMMTEMPDGKTTQLVALLDSLTAQTQALLILSNNAPITGYIREDSLSITACQQRYSTISCAANDLMEKLNTIRIEYQHRDPALAHYFSELLTTLAFHGTQNKPPRPYPFTEDLPASIKAYQTQKRPDWAQQYYGPGAMEKIAIKHIPYAQKYLQSLIDQLSHTNMADIWASFKSTLLTIQECSTLAHNEERSKSTIEHLYESLVKFYNTLHALNQSSNASQGDFNGIQASINEYLIAIMLKGTIDMGVHISCNIQLIKGQQPLEPYTLPTDCQA